MLPQFNQSGTKPGTTDTMFVLYTTQFYIHPKSFSGGFSSTANFGLLRMAESSWWAELLSAVNVECLMKTASRDGACTKFYGSLYDFNINKTYVIWLSGGAKYSIMTWVFQITPTTNKGVNVIFELILVHSGVCCKSCSLHTLDM